MNGLTAILGYGAVGRATTAALLRRGSEVRVAQRKRPGDLPDEAQFATCDVLKPDDVRNAIASATQVVLSIGFPYDSRIWRAVWPTTIRNVVDACAASGARLVFVDNLYQLGPQTKPRHEDMPLSARREKPSILTEVTKIWMAASAAGRARIASLRCTDFYGPFVEVSHLGSFGFGALAQHRSALLVVPPDIPHDFAYVPDIARAIVTLLDAPDDAFGQVWNMPCAPTRTPREILRIGATALGATLKIRTVPFWLVPFAGIFSRFLKEVADVGFTWDRPYVVDARKFTTRFWSDVTSIESGAAETAKSFASLAKE